MDADVVVVGLGPVGTVLTALLGRYGLKTIAIEKEETLFPHPRAAHVDHTGLRTIQEIGCLDPILEKVVPNQRLDILSAERKVLARIPANQESVSGLPTSVYFYQPEFDGELRKAAASYPTVEIRLGHEMTSITQEPNEVVVGTRNKHGVDSKLRASWVVGCDGAWSPVREAAGLKLSSFNFDERWLVLDLVINSRNADLPIDHVIEVCDPARPYLSTPISPNRQRFEFMLLPGEDAEYMKQEAVTTELLKSWLAAIDYKIERSAVYTFHGLVAESWRNGRVLIAGDAAHQTPPFLGQGMCAGLRDASNLAWKLRQILRQGAPEALIDTYESERSPHAQKVIEAAIRIGKVICELDPDKAAARDTMLLNNDPSITRGLTFTLPRLAQGPIVLPGGGSLFVQPVIGGDRLDDIVGSRFLVIARSLEALGTTANWWKAEMNAMVYLLSDLESGALNRWFDRYETDVVVVRPDRYVLGTADNLDTMTEAVVKVLKSSAPPSVPRQKPASVAS